MVQLTFIAEDAQGSFNPDDRIAIYLVGDRVVRVPASLSGQALKDALYAEAGIDPAIDQLVAEWQTIQAQAATRPLATMDITEVIDWINTNVSDVNSIRTAFREVAKELFILRAENRVLAKALAYLFQ